MPNTTTVGRDAEDEAAAFLERKGFKIIAKNWRTRFCEIDLIAQKCARVGLKRKCRIHIVEVKFRKSQQYGSAEEYVTPAKQKQLIKAAEHWTHEHKWTGPYQIDVIGIDGVAGTVAYIPNITG